MVSRCFNVLSGIHFVRSEHQAENSQTDDETDTEKPLDIPKELWMMVDHLFRNALNQVRRKLLTLLFGWSYKI